MTVIMFFLIFSCADKDRAQSQSEAGAEARVGIPDCWTQIVRIGVGLPIRPIERPDKSADPLAGGPGSIKSGRQPEAGIMFKVHSPTRTSVRVRVRHSGHMTGRN